MCSLAYIKITKCFVEFEIFLRKYFKGNKAKNDIGFWPASYQKLITKRNCEDIHIY